MSEYFFSGVMQATLATLLTFLLGLPFVFFLLHLHSRPGLRILFWPAEFILLIPNFLPAIFNLVWFYELFPHMRTGYFAVSICQAFVNAGIFAIVIKNAILEKLTPVREMAILFGASEFLFWRRAWRILFRNLFAAFVLIWTLCFASFSYPFILGGGRSTNLEIFIYEKLKIEHEFTPAIGAAILQFVVFYTLTGFASSAFANQREATARWQFPKLFVFAALLILTFGFYPWIKISSSVLFHTHTFSESLWSPMILTLQIGVIVSILAWLTFSGFLMAESHSKVSPRSYFMGPRLVERFAIPGLSLFGIVALRISNLVDPFFVYLIFLFLLFLPTILRLGFFSMVDGLREQVRQARFYGASRALVFRRIFFPPMRRNLLFLTSVMAAWAAGDFSLAQIVFSQPKILPLWIQGALSTYRFEQAQAYLLPLVLILIFLFILNWSFASVLDQWAKKEIY